MRRSIVARGWPVLHVRWVDTEIWNAIHDLALFIVIWFAAKYGAIADVIIWVVTFVAEIKPFVVGVVFQRMCYRFAIFVTTESRIIRFPIVLIRKTK